MATWLDDNWSYVSLATAVALLIVYPFVLTFDLERPTWAFWALLPLLMLHQFEKFGWPGGFRRWWNRVQFGSDTDDAPLTRRLARQLNFGIPYLIVLAAAALGERFLWFPILVLSVGMVSGCYHVLRSTTDLQYAPGSVTSMLGLVPLALFTMHAYVTSGLLNWPTLLLALLGALILHMLHFVRMWRRVQASEAGD